MSLFTVVDMSDCYWHKKLTDESSYLCTFNTPTGRMKFNRMPFGLCCSADVAQKMVQDNFGDLQGVIVVHDDIIVGASNAGEHDIRLEAVLQHA